MVARRRSRLREADQEPPTGSRNTERRHQAQVLAAMQDAKGHKAHVRGNDPPKKKQKGVYRTTLDTAMDNSFTNNYHGNASHDEDPEEMQAQRQMKMLLDTPLCQYYIPALADI